MQTPFHPLAERRASASRGYYRFDEEAYRSYEDSVQREVTARANRVRAERTGCICKDGIPIHHHSGLRRRCPCGAECTCYCKGCANVKFEKLEHDVSAPPRPRQPVLPPIGGTQLTFL